MKRNKLFVAITGGIGSGKSTVAGIIRELGYPVFSADAIAHNIYNEPSVLKEVAEKFPQCVQEGVLDRKKMAETVFSDREKLAALNEITHPVIMRRLLSDMERSDGKVVFAEVPLLFESGSEAMFDRVIVVLRDRRARIGAVMKRDGVTEPEVVSRIQNQFDYERNPNTGHTVLYNDGDLKSLQSGVVRIIDEILRSVCP